MFCGPKFDGVLSLIGGFSLHLTLGTLYSFGNMNTYMASYLRKHVDPEIQYSDLVWIPTLATIGQGLFMTCSGNLEEKIGVRFTLLVGSTIMTSGVYLTAISIQTSVFMTIFTYGFLFGLGTALAYAPPLGVAMKWYPKRKGVANGVIVGGFGLGAFVFNQVQSVYLNPNNEPVDSDGYFSNDQILNRVPSVFLLLGSIYGVIQALSVLLISVPSNSNEQSMVPLVSSAIDSDDESEHLFHESSVDDDEVDNSSRTLNVSIQSQDDDNLKPGQIVRSKEFWILWCTFFLNSQAITYINSMYKVYGQTFINDDHYLAIVGAFAAIFNATGRIIWGYLCDKIGYRSCMILITISIAFFYSSFYFIQGGGKAVFAIWVWGIFFSFCANFVLLPTATAQCFGTKYSSKNYGLVMTGQAAAAPLIATLTMVLNPLLGWFWMFIIISGFSLTCTILTMKFPRRPSPRAILDRIDVSPSNL